MIEFEIIGEVPSIKTRKCLICRKTFKVTPQVKFSNTKYCSIKCVGKANALRARREVVCPICGKLFTTRQCRINAGRGKHCSKKCRELSYIGKIGHNHGKFGKEHSAWKGGVKIANGRYYIYSPEHPCADKNKYIKRSRYNLEAHLKIVLPKKVVIHHVDRNKANDSVDNLMIFPDDSSHIKYHRSIKHDW